MTEYWLISAPGDETCQQTWETMNNLTSKQNSLSDNYKFHIPDLKVGTLDQLVGLSDDLGKLDAFVEQVTRKVATYLGEVLEDQRDKLHENLMANNSEYFIDSQYVPLTYVSLHIRNFYFSFFNVSAEEYVGKGPKNQTFFKAKIDSSNQRAPLFFHKIKVTDSVTRKYWRLKIVCIQEHIVISDFFLLLSIDA